MFLSYNNNCEDDSVKSKAQAYVELLTIIQKIMIKHYNHLVKIAGYVQLTTITSTSYLFLNQHLKTLRAHYKSLFFNALENNLFYQIE